MIQLLSFLLIFATHFAYTAPKEESEQIVIKLNTENQLIPIYLAKLTDDNSGLPTNYLKQLEEVLQFDLNHNGMTYTVMQNAEAEKLAQQFASTQQYKLKDWQTKNIYYLITLHTKKDKQLDALMLSVNADAIKSIENVSLSGDLRQDRKQIHQLADAVHRALFGKDGIATTHILYTIKKQSGNNQWSSEIWECDYDGENARRIIQEGYNVTPVYIPPKPGSLSGSFLYTSYQAAQPKIYVASLRDGSRRRLTSLRGNQLMPSITRQRDSIAFISDVTGNPDLFMQEFNIEKGAIGKPSQIFSARKSTQGSPTFDPEGNRLAFVSNKDGSPKIYLMDIPAPGVALKDITAQLLTKHSKEGSAPSWSPDGSKIAYCAMTNGVRQIWVYDFTTNQERQLTQGAGNKENPTWAPNSLSLIYNSSDPGASDLYLININQPKATKITSGIGEKRFPNWEPRT